MGVAAGVLVAVGITPPISGLTASLKSLAAELQASGRPSQLQVFKDANAIQEFVLLQSFDQPSLTPVSVGAGRNGWNRDFFLDPSDCLAKARLFELPSTFLLGDDHLKVQPDAFVVAQHVAVAPQRRDLYLPCFQRLAQALQGQSGLEGFQVWAWNSRPDHWTLISVWRDIHAAEAGPRLPEPVARWNQISADSASPRNASHCRRFDMGQ